MAFAGNTLTRLIPDAFAAVQQVSRELVGYINAVGSNLNGIPVALGQSIVIPIAPNTTTTDIVPSMIPVEPAGQTIGNVTVEITKSKFATFAYTGEEDKGLSWGPGRLSIQAKQIAQAMRKLTNEVELDVALAASRGAGRSIGIAGTTPFASNLGDVADARKVLEDNGAPTGDLQFVMNTTAGANVFKLTQLTNVNQAADQDLLRRGVMSDLDGFALRKTGNGASFIAATVTNATVTANQSAGVTSIGVTTAAGGSVILLAGQFITLAGDSNKYIVASDVTIGASTTGTIVVANPGLVEDTTATTVITGSGAFSANTAFDRDAIQLITRTPAIPMGGDRRADMFTVTDEVSGLTFEISLWLGEYMNAYKVALAWGTKAVKSNNIVTVLG